MTEEPLLKVTNVTKRYGAVQALSGVDFELRAGEVVGLLGDNGAGKSTLAGVLSGSVRPTTGEMWLDGERIELGSPHEARERGIETAYQDLALAPDLTVAENMFLGRELIKGPRLFGWLDRKAMNARSAEELERLSVRIRSVKARARAFSGGQRQAVAIGRAVTWSTKVLLLDEPTAALGVRQQELVGTLIREASERGLGIVLISHNMQQVLELCSRVVVLFHGRPVADLPTEGTDVNEIVSYITGAALGPSKGGKR